MHVVVRVTTLLLGFVRSADRPSAFGEAMVDPFVAQLGRGWLRGSNGRKGAVLELASDLLRARLAAEAGYEVKGHVDAGADAGAGDEVAVVDEA